MSSLQTYHVENWGAFIEDNDIDLSCPACGGEGTDARGNSCDDCAGVGYMEILWDTIWNTGFSSGRLSVPAEAHGVAIFGWDGEIWFGLQGCGMDMTPHLAAAWIETFPDCQWLPEQFCVSGINLREGYVESCVGKKLARRIYAVMGKTVKGMRQQAAVMAEDLRAARKRLARKE